MATPQHGFEHGDRRPLNRVQRVRAVMPPTPGKREPTFIVARAYDAQLTSRSRASHLGTAEPEHR